MCSVNAYSWLNFRSIWRDYYYMCVHNTHILYLCAQYNKCLCVQRTYCARAFVTLSLCLRKFYCCSSIEKRMFRCVNGWTWCVYLLASPTACQPDCRLCVTADRPFSLWRTVADVFPKQHRKKYMYFLFVRVHCMFESTLIRYTQCSMDSVCRL